MSNFGKGGEKKGLHKGLPSFPGLGPMKFQNQTSILQLEDTFIRSDRRQVKERVKQSDEGCQIFCKVLKFFSSVFNTW